jgi:hypothetical protein
MLTIAMAVAISMCSLGHFEKLTSVFGGHHIFMNFSLVEKRMDLVHIHLSIAWKNYAYL